MVMAAPDAQDDIFEAVEDVVRIAYGLEDDVDSTDLRRICKERARMTNDSKAIQLSQSLYSMYTLRKKQNDISSSMHNASPVSTQQTTPDSSVDRRTAVADGTNTVERKPRTFTARLDPMFMEAPNARDDILEAVENAVRIAYGLEDSVDSTDLRRICEQRAKMARDSKAIKLLDVLCRVYAWRKQQNDNAITLPTHDALPVFTLPKVPGTSVDRKTAVQDGANTLERERATFAVVVGINSYGEGFKLNGANKDALSVYDFLLHDLQIPSAHIKLLLDHDATRQCIMDALHTHLLNNPDIRPGDAIIFYFAGHGSSHDAPGKGAVEYIMAVDGKLICEHELHTFLKDLSHAKGKNITVILDCCFAAGCTRDGWSAHPGSSGLYSGSQRVRRVDPSVVAAIQGLPGSDCAHCLAGDDDWERDMTTHVLLAACRDYELAFENAKGGAFTVALLRHLRSVPRDTITYKQLMDSFPNLGPRQHPVAVGDHRNDTLFRIGWHDSQKSSSAAR
ncbi:uncharacterized protein LAESUDRAFT_764157 [Laetiporus sulphureus 93-53]|uniref:Peptidase C14 caspase domain-containing protein n=1 Tax=Laetiporus sulphureus 93-53 TaxID=1314785 RepID=A0A165BFD4_9APHY|nr:uncharacterized protein LAESUDRAFT_764157 [Laetiporus sulphureus 93-53]KZT00937.1 hypothetical protein LAESUDRAFT_764157 [Laetiporus sulphureus 93-53]